MKKFTLLAPASLLFLAACSSGPATSTDLTSQLKNPLYAELYYDSLVDHMVNLVIQNDPLSKDAKVSKIIERNRMTGLELARMATQKQAKGKIGNIVSDPGYAIGEVLLLDNVLYVGPGFETLPGPDLHMYLSAILDPRDATFPDDSAIDLGVINSAFGAHSYNVPTSETTSPHLKTAVLFDKKLNRIYGFAQLQTRN